LARAEEVIPAFYRDRVYPKLVDLLGNPTPIQVLRRRILPLAEGAVLELGFGSGVNLAYYDPARIARLYALEPNKGMTRIAERHPRRKVFDLQFLDLRGEQIPLADGSIDTVVSTFTLCTVDSIHEAIHGISRVLKRDGRLIVIENTVSPHKSVSRWQKFWAPAHRRVFAGLDLTRDICSAIEAGNFKFDELETGYLARFPKSWSYCCWGVATPKPASGRLTSIQLFD
jgi:SAM-dependent methyltransferase